MSDRQSLGAISAQLVQAGLEGGNPFRFRIVTESMRPSLRPGDDVIVQQVAWQQLRTGDVVLCDSGRMLVAHRLLGIRSNAGELLLVTKGDANWRADAPYELRAYRGKVVRVERAGARATDLDSPRARLVARVRAGFSLGQAMLMQMYRKLKSRLGVALLLAALLLVCVTSALAAVTISSFSATGGNNQIKLNWSTATELKNFGFNVERSTDQSHWTKIGNVSSQSPCVQSLETLNYSYTDSNLLAGTKYYYRLQLVGSPCGDPDQYYPQTVNATTSGAAPGGTPTPTNIPTATSKAGAPTATRTNTPIPPTATRTNTPVPPTATRTNTPVPPTATATNTPEVPSATPTNSPLPTATPSLTPAPVTSTPAATATATSPAAPSPVPTALPAYPLPAIVSPTPVVPAATAEPATPTTGAPSGDATTVPAAPTEVALVVPTSAPANTGASGAQGTTPEGPVDANPPGAPAQNTPQAGSPLNLVVPLGAAALGFTLLAVAGILLWRQRRLSAPKAPKPPTDET